MKNLVLHPVTAQQLDSFAESPSHALMLVGPAGIGKGVLSRKLSEAVLGISVDGLDDYPYKLIIAPEDGKAISIEAVRELEHFLSLKVPRQESFNRVVIFEDSHKLGIEAQNALLKTLEEPPEDSLIILNVSYEQALLPTVRSRSQVVSVKRPEKQTLITHFEEKEHSQKEVTQAYAISGGLPGLMHALLNDESHPLKQATEKARQILSQSSYERLLLVDELSKNKELALDITSILQQMAHISLQSATGAAAKKWQNVLKVSYETSEALTNSAQPKLALTNMMLNL